MVRCFARLCVVHERPHERRRAASERAVRAATRRHTIPSTLARRGLARFLTPAVGAAPRDKNGGRVARARAAPRAWAARGAPPLQYGALFSGMLLFELSMYWPCSAARCLSDDTTPLLQVTAATVVTIITVITVVTLVTVSLPLGRHDAAALGLVWLRLSDDAGASE